MLTSFISANASLEPCRRSKCGGPSDLAIHARHLSLVHPMASTVVNLCAQRHIHQRTHRQSLISCCDEWPISPVSRTPLSWSMSHMGRSGCWLLFKIESQHNSFTTSSWRILLTFSFTSKKYFRIHSILVCRISGTYQFRWWGAGFEVPDMVWIWIQQDLLLQDPLWFMHNLRATLFWTSTTCPSVAETRRLTNSNRNFLP